MEKKNSPPCGDLWSPNWLLVGTSGCAHWFEKYIVHLPGCRPPGKVFSPSESATVIPLLTNIAMPVPACFIQSFSQDHEVQRVLNTLGNTYVTLWYPSVVHSPLMDNSW